MQLRNPAFVLAAMLALCAGCEPAGPSLGEQIYRDGVGVSGRLQYDKGPDWLRFAGPACLVCHGERGQGLTVQAGDVTGAAPAITWTALTERGYDEAAFRRALLTGVDPHGRVFIDYMPRWQLSEAEAEALIEYLRGL
jgi:mono/diheme cytochrome c family protein